MSANTWNRNGNFFSLHLQDSACSYFKEFCNLSIKKKNVALTIGKGRLLQIDLPFPCLLLDLSAASPLTGEQSQMRIEVTD